jgi:hypothetical protein
MYCNPSPEELVLIAAILSLAIARNRTSDELNVLGNLLVGVGTNLLIVAAAIPQNQPNTNNSNDNNGSNTNNQNDNDESNTNNKNNNSE